MACTFCNKLHEENFLESAFIVREFAHSYLMVGDHQTFPGYCVLFLKEHVKEAFDLKGQKQIEVYQELMLAAKAVKEAFHAEKINLSNYGNMTPHQHWHIFPRQTSDRNWPNPPWTLMPEFIENPTTPEKASEVRKKILDFLPSK